MRFPTFTLTALVLAGAAGAVTASDDLTIVSKNTLNGKPGATTTDYISSDHIRRASAEGHETIWDLKAGMMTTLDGKKKTYFTTTKQDLEQFRIKMEEKMKDPEMKKGMEMIASMSAGVAGTMDVKKTGTTRNVAGFRCEEWAITMTAMSTMKECVTTDLQYPAHAWEAQKEFAESMKSSMSAFAPIAKGGAEFGEKMKAIKGFPVATSMKIDVMGNKTTSESEVIEVRKGSIPASAWEVPAGYTKIENPMLKAFEGHGRERPRR